MRKFLSFIFFFSFFNSYSQVNEWQIAPVPIKTIWADSVDPAHPLPEYPRPQMQRTGWTNLNGLWQYKILPASGSQQIPSSFDGKILVPFCIESALSGVGKTIGEDSILWYHTTFTVPGKIKGKRVLLHFGAVDWRAQVFINGVNAGSHEGGYDPFSFDITDLLKKGSSQQLDISVWDPTDKGYQPRGKQVVKPGGIWYTAVTGIWQTVWLEMVSETYIGSVRQTPDVDKGQLKVEAAVQNFQQGDEIRFTSLKGNEVVAEKTGSKATEILSLANPHLWSPDDPFLYDLKIAVIRKGKVVDEVKSYFAMRKISVAADRNGIQRMMLNDHFLFQFGPLDQGWWPDGLYTAPTDAALQYDLRMTKEMGLNMIRKHVKVEPARWYYYCDLMGIMIWQDMPSGDLGNHWEPYPGILRNQTDKDRSPESENDYKKEWTAIMNSLYNFPCIVVWVPFNEAWGQFKTGEIVQMTMHNDPTRLVNSASGGNYYDVGNIIDLHNYPDPAMPEPSLFGKTRAIVLGEFGGLGLPLDGHTWQQKSWGYQSFSTNDSMFRRYSSMIRRIEDFIPIGLSAAVYTQTTDVEGEVNGFMTYDRKVLKMPLEKLRTVNKRLYDIFKE